MSFPNILSTFSLGSPEHDRSYHTFPLSSQTYASTFLRFPLHFYLQSLLKENVLMIPSSSFRPFKLWPDIWKEIVRRDSSYRRALATWSWRWSAACDSGLITTVKDGSVSSSFGWCCEKDVGYKDYSNKLCMWVP